MEVNKMLKEMAKFAGKTFHEVEKITGEIYSDFMGKDDSKEERSIKQRMQDDLHHLYQELGENVLSHLQQNDALGDGNLKGIVLKIEKIQKTLQDLIEIENEMNQREKSPEVAPQEKSEEVFEEPAKENTESKEIEQRDNINDTNNTSNTEDTRS
ncbi:MAG: hypothetical protein HQK50_09755 [Oligoflexia bacterium]|nr:hypothetical protein [Oligoflexia bacterium]MBF0365847.1 hypothetical protein [Oligoflexia bacterium]